ncbi:MAG: AMP-binding protein [Chryseobacterium sp.]|uniref:AMP-binding protein n=1 Tax=Chryseobacterium sp. TaxID=1871047 RepID=UPI0025C0E3F6|nr:AMP-binding protein [Chryseobacterium sp.]MCJ7934778.1 AMP-binding protein [Chryseobacterium sp.]
MKQQEKVQDLNLTSVKKDLKDYNNTYSSFPDQCTLSDLFFEQVESVPHNIAIVEKDKQYTYLELETEVGRLTQILQDYQLEDGSAVIILLEPGFQLLAAMLAVQRSGHYYVPIDIRSSVSHVHYMVSDTNPGLILTNNTISLNYSFNRRALVCLVDASLSVNKINKSVESKAPINIESTAYVMYTSGTSGRPKRVAISHRSLVNYCFWAMHKYCNGVTCNFPLITSVSFDLTITSLFVPLISGGSIVVYTGDEEETPVLQAIKENKVDIIKLTPSQLLSVAASAASQQQYIHSRVKAFILGGEDLSAKLCHKITRLFGEKIKIYNEYGPTEATVGCMIYEFDKNNNTTGLIPVGNPISNSRIYLLNNLLMPVDGDEVGEIYIAGSGLAKEYMDNPKMNVERFIPDPFFEGKQMYKSGDLGRWNSRGELECLGRLERKLVVGEFTVLLTDIENIIGTHDSILSSFTTIQKKTDDTHLLTTYIVPDDDSYLVNQNKTDQLKKELLLLLNNLLSAVYINIEFIFIKNFPLNLNDKIALDRLPVISEINSEI